MFIEKLKRKAENAGGRVEEINTYKTKLSQVCQCGKFKKKTRGERWQECPCGVKVQRDLYSAFLACFVKDNKLIAAQAKKAWVGLEAILHTAMSKLKHSIRGHLPSSLGLKKN